MVEEGYLTQELTEVQMSLDELAKTQGTRLSDIPPWMSYAAQFEEKLNPELEEAVKQYSEVRHEKSSSQNEEELCRQKEYSDEVSKQYQWLNPEDYKDEEARVGRVMHSSTLINKLRKECKLICFYREHPHQDKLTLLAQPINKPGAEPEVACWVQKGMAPEFSMMNFDDHGAPLGEKRRGWRTVLLQLLIKEFLTEEIIYKVFGEAVGPASTRYNAILYGVRNTKEE